MSIDLGKALLYLNADPTELNRALIKAKRNSRKNLTGIIDLTQQVGKAFTAIGAGITVGLGAAVKESMSFRSSLSEVATLGVEDLEGLGDAARNVAKDFGLDVVDAVNATYQAISAGASEAETPFVLEESAMAAKAGVTELATAVDLGMGTVNAFGMEMDSITQVFDESFTAVKMGVTTFEELSASVGKVAPIMASAGLKTEEMFAAVSALTKGGVSTKESVTALKNAMTAIIKPTSRARITAEELGLSFNAQALEAKGLEGFLQSVREATGGNIETMSQLFGGVEGLNAVLALTGEQSESFSQILEEMGSSTGAAKEAFEALKASDPSFAFEQAKAEVKDLMIEVGDALIPILTSLMEDVISPLLGWIADFARENEGLTKTIVIVTGVVGALLLVFGPLLIVLPGLVTFVSMLGAALPILGAAFGALLGPIGLVVGAIIAVVAAVIYFWDEIVAYYEWAWGVIVDIAKGTWEELKWVWEKIVDGATWLWEGIVQAFTGVKDFMGNVWEGIVQVVQSAWQRITGFVGDILGGVWNAIKAVGQLAGIGGGVQGPQVNLGGGGAVGGQGLPRLPAMAAQGRGFGGGEGNGGITVNAPVYVPNAVNLDPDAADRVGRQVADGVNREIGQAVRRRRG